MRTAVPLIVKRTKIPDSTDLSKVPAIYHDLASVFSKQRTLSLPLHWPYDCAIDLLPGAPLPSSHLL